MGTIEPRQSRTLRIQRGVRSIMNTVMGDRDRVPEDIRNLVSILARTNPDIDMDKVIEAYHVAERAHRTQVRKSGERYIIHPVQVTEILAELGVDTDTIVAALLHDVVEDSDVTSEQIAFTFGETVAFLVEGVTKISKAAAKSSDVREAETLRKMLIHIAKDERVVMIKIADRIHNMRTIHHMRREKQLEKAEETVNIYAPLAGRLGMQQFKYELEDRSFSTADPSRYDALKQMVAERQPEAQAYVDKTIIQLKEILNKSHIKGQVSGRSKQLWSIQQKMSDPNDPKSFDDIHDIVGVRVIVPTINDCYSLLGQIHQTWEPKENRFKDYIARPKENQYQSLHTTVFGPGRRSVEVQIRTHAMHETAEHGIAAHWMYKAKGRQAETRRIWLETLVESQENLEERELTQAVKTDLVAEDLYVYTPKGKILTLPKGSTPVDYAFAVHTEVGYRTVGAKVDNKLVNINYKLQTGQTVEILIDKGANAGPKRDWLEFVVSSRAKSKIKAWFSRERRDEAIERGKEELEQAIARTGAGKKKLAAGNYLAKVLDELNIDSEEALHRAIGDGQRSAQSVAQRMAQLLQQDESPKPVQREVITKTLAPTTRQHPKHTDKVLVQGRDDVLTVFGACCSPVPGDKIFGYTTRGRGITVHRHDCTNAENLLAQSNRIVEVSWNDEDNHEMSAYTVHLELLAFPSDQLLSNVVATVAESQARLMSFSSHTTAKGDTAVHLTVGLAGQEHLESLLRNFKRVDGVYQAIRANTVSIRPGGATGSFRGAPVGELE